MGPLKGIRVIELAGLGPCPMAGMMLADMGAEVIRVERSSKYGPMQRGDVSLRGKKSIALNLKSAAGVEALLRLTDQADALIEGFRPGITERLGIGPEVCRERNPKLVYGRMTGWGQNGPLAHTAGHDINYIALSGALHAIGNAGEKPVVPLNIVGDMGGGGMLLAFGVVSALFEALKSGQGQVVDAAMVDGAAQLMWMQYGWAASGLWNGAERGANLLDGAAHFYDTYETADNKYVAVGSIEPQFYAELIVRTGVDAETFASQTDPSRWPELKAELTRVFKTKTREQWCDIMQDSDVCFAPVLDLLEAPEHPHNQARETFIKVDNMTQPAPAPRYSRTAPQQPEPGPASGEHGEQILASAGYSAQEIESLKQDGVLLIAN